MRTLFILVTVLCVLLVPLSVKLYQARQQRLAVEWVLENGGSVFYTYHRKNDGNYSVEWIGANNNGNAVESGIYFYRLQTELFVETKKMLMLK